MKPPISSLIYKGNEQSKGHQYYAFTKGKRYDAELCKIIGHLYNYWITNDVGEKIMVSNTARKKYFISIK